MVPRLTGIVGPTGDQGWRALHAGAMGDSLVLPEPWAETPAKAWSGLRKLVAHDAAALLLLSPARPDAAAVLGSRALTGDHVTDWLSACGKGDALLKRAARVGAAVSESALDKPAGGLPAGLHAVVVAERCAPGSARYWTLVLGRRAGVFSPLEQARAQMVLAMIRTRFEIPPPGEPGLRRTLAQPDGRLIHADLRSRLTDPANALASRQTLVNDLLAVAAQRWPGKPGATPRDLFPPLAGNAPAWARLTRLSVPGRRAGGAVYLTLRPIHGIAPPPVGLVEDGRVAQALGVLTDRYAQAPALNDLAKRFKVSPFHFQRLFTAQAGISPKHLVLRVQLLHARSALRTTHDPIQQIAAGCGFSSHGHFTATFHRLVGVTPLDYRLGAAPPDSCAR